MTKNNIENNMLKISFTTYLKEKYSFHGLFLPAYGPADDHISAEEVHELERLIQARDHFEIRQQIAKRYSNLN